MKHTFRSITQSVIAAVMMSLWFSSAFVPSAFAQGSLMVNPKRIVLDDRKRVDNVTLFNSSDDTTSFAISLLHYAMQEDGSFKEIPDSVTTYAATYADSVIRFFPSQVTLPPHESQAIHVRYLKPMNLASGEYRSHIYFRSIERAKAIEQKAQDTADHMIHLEIRPIFGLSIPIIVRSGSSLATVTMDSVTVSAIDTGGNGTISAQLHRAGNESCYGSFIVKYRDAGGTETQVGLVKGVAVYVPLAMRRVSVAFKMPAGTEATKGSFRLEYQTLTDNPKEQVLAAAELPAKK